ncbi:MAG: NAD-dependent epimerase/dehydratase family protein [Candidatus Dormibacteria bacterium]|jgi:dihydroflavonol-4-reductase
MGDDVFLTGATGFVGGHVLDALLESGYSVRALVRGSRARLAARPSLTVVGGDVRDGGALVPSIRGCRYLVHVAAGYSFAPRDRRELEEVNVAGTRGLLEAARLAGVEKAVVTSSSAAVGPLRGGRLATESDWAEVHGGHGYHASKVRQERAALRANLPVVTVLPTAPIGPRDARPTPTGQLVVDVMRGRMPAYLEGAMNLVAVEDAGRAHVLALERGRPGERYLVGGQNLSLAEVMDLFARHAGTRPPAWRMPYTVALTAAWVDEARCRLLPGARPRVPLEGVRMGRQRMLVRIDKAKDELGFRPTSVEDAAGRAVAWYRDHGYA